MIQTQCGGCGLVMGFDDSMAGQIAACPNCGRMIVVRPGVAKQGLHGRKDLTSRATGIVCGLLILSTIVIPWQIDPLAMLWNIIREISQKETAFIIVVLSTGLAAFVMACATRAMVLATAYLLISGATLAAIFCYSGSRDEVAKMLELQFPLIGWFSPLKLWAILALLGLVVLCNLRIKIGSSIILNLMQMICSIAACVILGICCLKMIKSMPAWPSEHPAYNCTADIFGFAFLGLATVGCLLAFGHSLAFKAKGGAASGIAVSFIWLTILGQVFFGIIKDVIDAGDVRLIFTPIIIALMIMPLFLIAAEGLASMVANIASLCAADPAKAQQANVRMQQTISYQPAGQPISIQVQPGGTIQTKPTAASALQPPQAATNAAERLVELQKLLSQGLITQDEYNAKRARIIDSL